MKGKLADIVATVSRWHPLRLLVLGYGSYILLTWLALSLPVCLEQGRVSALDNLFIATSAVSTTGLTTVSTSGAYSLPGEIVILLAFQLGGLGYMTLGSFVILSRRRDLPEVRKRVGSAAFSLPKGFDLGVFLRHVVIYTTLVEAAGALGLYLAFSRAGVESPFWPAVFHSVSAFCTAGFSVFPDSLERFRADFWVNAIVGILSMLGAIGFLVCSDWWLTLTQRRSRMALTSKIILHMTLWSIIVGWVLLFLMEPSMQTLTAPERLISSGFQSMSALTTVGFNTHPIGTMHMAAVLVVIVLMIMGASPAGTGGGLKSTSVSAAFAVVRTVIRGGTQVTFWGRRVPEHRLHAAFAATVFYVAIFIAGSGLLMLVETHDFEDLLFEAASAIGTVGLSRGITGELSSIGKIMVIALMFIGRIGPLTFGLAVFSRETGQEDDKVEDLAI